MQVIDVEGHGGTIYGDQQLSQADMKALEKGWCYNFGKGSTARKEDTEEDFHPKAVPKHMYEPIFAKMQEAWRANSPKKHRIQPRVAGEQSSSSSSSSQASKSRSKEDGWNKNTSIRDGEHPWEEDEEIKDPYEQRPFHANHLPRSTTESRYEEMQRKTKADRARRVAEAKSNLIAMSRPFSFEKRENGQLKNSVVSKVEPIKPKKVKRKPWKEGDPLTPFLPSGPATRIVDQPRPQIAKSPPNFKELATSFEDAAEARKKEYKKFLEDKLEKAKVKPYKAARSKTGLTSREISKLTDGYITQVPTSLEEAKSMGQKIIDEEGTKIWKKYTGLTDVPESEADFEALRKTLLAKAQPKYSFQPTIGKGET